MGSSKLKPWREVAVPHEDVLKGTFKQAEFAADISRVNKNDASKEYQDPTLFFERTYITEGMRLLLDSVVKRLSGQGGDPVIQLQTAFGGGKTHTMLAVYHLAKGKHPVKDLKGIPPILDGAKVMEIPKTHVVVLDGNDLAPNIPKKHGAIQAHTMWGELAWQLGGEKGYNRIKNADISGTSPGKDELTQLLRDYSPCVILIDELVAYIRQFEEGKEYTGGTYDSNLSFIQALTEALKAVPTGVLLASLPESAREAGSARGASTLHTLEHYIARVQAIWKPVAPEEAFEIVRKRLFSDITDESAKKAVCRAFADYYLEYQNDFPNETQSSRYYDRLVSAYPIHPEVFDRLYLDWSSLENFQKTRGVLKLMAKVIFRLWKDGNNDYLIMPGSLPLYDADTRNEVIYNLPQGWDPVVEKEIDGDNAETTEIENKDTRLGSLQACRRVARTIFLGTAPDSSDQISHAGIAARHEAKNRGIEEKQVLLGSAQPGQQTGIYKDAIKRLADRLHNFYSENKRYWFDTRPSLRREMEERKQRFDDQHDVYPAIRTILNNIVKGGIFTGIHPFVQSNDIPDDSGLRLVILPPDATYGKAALKNAEWVASDILKKRGDQPRQRQNRLIFLAADAEVATLLNDHVRISLAWKSIVDDYENDRLVLDNLMAQSARRNLTNSQPTTQRIIREAYKWLLVPSQDIRNNKPASDITWEHYQINPSQTNFMQEVTRVLCENEAVIEQWAPIHLKNLLTTWFLKDEVFEVNAREIWQKMCNYLYLPRLKTEAVFSEVISEASGSKEYFGIASGKDGEHYIGFTFGQPRVSVHLDDSLLLIDPRYASKFQQQVESKSPNVALNTSTGGEISTIVPVEPVPAPTEVMRKFYGSTQIDPVRASIDFAQIVDEVVQHFALKHNVKIEITVHIDAESSEGFDKNLQRTVKENCNSLKFKSAEFEKGE